MRKGLVWLAAALTFVAAEARAQKITATLRGTVTDASGAVMPGARVTATNEGTGLTRATTTNAAGLYSFAELPVGSYRVEVEQSGFKTEVRTRVALSVADARAVDVELRPGDLTETVSVEVAAVAVKTVGGD